MKPRNMFVETFRENSSCPDCGRKEVRIANKDEVKEFHRLQAILAEEIRTGLYPAAG